HAFRGQEFVGAAAETLGQHDELAGCRNLARSDPALRLEGSDLFSQFQQDGRKSVELLQRVPEAGQFVLQLENGRAGLVGIAPDLRSLVELRGHYRIRRRDFAALVK